MARQERLQDHEEIQSLWAVAAQCTKVLCLEIRAILAIYAIQATQASRCGTFPMNAPHDVSQNRVTH
jgi:hypothetical protein